MVKALRSCLEAAKGKIKAGHLILRKSPKRTATGSSTASNISRIECLSHARNNVSKDVACLSQECPLPPLEGRALHSQECFLPPRRGFNLRCTRERLHSQECFFPPRGGFNLRCTQFTTQR